jgi:haloacetate dehalogenase
MGSFPTAGLFDGSSLLDCASSRARFAGVMRGEGQPVLLLHGYPQTHVTWHAVAPASAARFAVVIPDLPGYGRSQLLDRGSWDKRAVAAELVTLMQKLGHERL